MPVEISVGPPALTINQGSTFMVTDLNGEIRTESELGVFADDTRLVSHYTIYADGYPWRRLTSATTNYYAARIYLTNPAFTTEDGPVPEGTLALYIGRQVGEGIHEDLDVTNHGLAPVRFNLELALRSDFADLFEVKSHKFVRRGHVETTWDPGQGELHTYYDNRDFHRCFVYRLLDSTSPASYANGRLSFVVELAPGATWHTCAHYVFIAGARVRGPLYGCDHLTELTELDRLHGQWIGSTTTLGSSNEDIHRLYRQSLEDMGALRLHDQDFAPDVWLPAAGVPWFVAVFGRDSLIVSLQNMLVHAGFARGALKRLAQLQATELDDWRDAEPGKMPHELRAGELAHFKQVPHTPYYGTADATPLYLITLHEAWKWLGEESVLRDYREVAIRCLEWIDRYGDLDGDGFVEYERASDRGLLNQGWKDSWDAIRFADGRIARPPIALCEIQGYVYAAYLARAHFADEAHDTTTAARYRAKASDLKDAFNRDFWLDDRGWYAMGLDGEKRPIDALASNMGHCLWTGIVDEDRAPAVAAQLLSSTMFSGFGIRTLADSMIGYNPVSYHNGSVWPHDNAIIAAGLMRYGFVEEAHRVILGCLDAASGQGHRLPELYGGLSRQEVRFPVAYPSSCSPQAWAAASPLLFLRTILRLDPWVPHGKVWLDPILPERIGYLRVDRIPLAGRRVTVEVDGPDVKVEGLPPEIEWVREPRKPLTA